MKNLKTKKQPKHVKEPDSKTRITSKKKRIKGGKLKKFIKRLPNWIKHILVIIAIPIALLIELITKLFSIFIKLSKPVGKYILRNIISIITLLILIFTIYTGYNINNNLNSKIEQSADQLQQELTSQNEEINKLKEDTNKKLEEKDKTIEEQNKQIETLKKQVTSRGSTTTRTTNTTQTKTTNTNTTKYADKNSYEYNVDLLARLIWSEASKTSTRDMQLVGCVVMNRVKYAQDNNYSSWGGKNATIHSVIYAKGQYAVTFGSNPAINRAAGEQAKTIAKQLLAGERFGCPTNVIYQAQFRQGSGLYEKVGVHYYCYK